METQAPAQHGGRMLRGLQALRLPVFVRPRHHNGPASDDEMDHQQRQLLERDAEKQARRGARNFVDVFLVLVRLWQLGSHLFIYISFVGLYSYISRNSLGGTARMRGIVQLALVSVIYSVVVVCCVWLFRRLKYAGWVAFAMSTIPGDLFMMGLAIAKITVLGLAGLPADCHGLTLNKFETNELARQPREGYQSIGFGPGTYGSRGELDYLCLLPKGVYGLCVVSIFSFTFSIVLTVHQLQRPKRLPQLDNPYPGHIEGVLPAFLPRRDVPGSASPGLAAPPAEMAQTRRVELIGVCTPGPSNPAQIPPRMGDVSVEPKYANMPPDVMPLGRPLVSAETTTSSVDPDLYLVTDGFRPPEDPPEYTSRPSSLYGPC